jgi:hypothetical protein
MSRICLVSYKIRDIYGASIGQLRGNLGVTTLLPLPLCDKQCYFPLFNTKRSFELIALMKRPINNLTKQTAMGVLEKRHLHVFQLKTQNSTLKTQDSKLALLQRGNTYKFWRICALQILWPLKKDKPCT